MSVNKKQERTVYKINLNKFYKHIARLATGGLKEGHPYAVKIMKECIFAKRGADIREITSQEAARLINKGMD
jgi:hypothetical protein